MIKLHMHNLEYKTCKRRKLTRTLVPLKNDNDGMEHIQTMAWKALLAVSTLDEHSWYLILLTVLYHNLNWLKYCDSDGPIRFKRPVQPTVFTWRLSFLSPKLVSILLICILLK